MIIHTVTEYEKSFVYWSTHRAIQTLSHMLNGRLISFAANYWGKHIAQSFGKGAKLSPELADLLIVEATYLEINNIDARALKAYYPKAKIVVLSSDAIYFVASGKWGGFQFPGLGEIDLFLELDPRVREHYTDLGYKNIDEWKWTASGALLNRIAETENPSFEQREYDFIGVYAPHTIAREGSYRNQMVAAIEAAGLKFTQGGGSGHSDNDIDRLIQHYKNSKFTLGTSSHDNPLLTQCVKGFRDFIGPACGAMLVYDRNPAIEDYGCQIPKYDSFNDLIMKHMFFSQSNDNREHVLECQQKWVIENTIEKQLFKKLKEHKLV